MSNKKRYIDKTEQLKKNENLRILRQIDTNSLLDLSSNDYLALAADKSLKNKFHSKYDIDRLKYSASSSRLLSGNSKEYQILESLIASSYKRESCLVFNSGYHANTGILPALTEKKDLIIADKLVHASIIDGMKLSKADFLRYNHTDYKHLESILNKKASSYENVFIVSESIFSMDGDKADIEKLVSIKKRYKAFLYIDEAHAVGAVGKNGLGCAEEYNLISEIDFIIGTFGKALASVGAYVVCDDIYKQYLINHARTLIFTTALPPVNIAWSTFIIEQLSDFNNRRIKLKTVSEQFAKMLNIKPESHIIPFIIGENYKAVKVSDDLKKAGFNVLPIRYPTVAKGTARLRFSMNSDINTDDLRLIIEHLLLNNDY